MIEDADGNYWFGSSGHGIIKYNSATGSFYKPPPEEFGSKMVFSFCNDVQHRAVWIGTFERGLYKYHLDSNKFERFLPNLRIPHRLHSALIYDIIQDNDANIWAATYSGLSKFTYGKPADEAFTNFSVETGLPENIVYSMVPDKKGNIWINTFKGLACINKKGSVVSTFGKTGGLQFNNFSNPLSITRDGEIGLGIDNGFIHFNPDSLVLESSNFPLVVSNWNAAGKNINLSDSANKHFFAYNQNDMQFEFAALNYSQPDQVQYEYKLEGWDKDWIHAGNTHFAKYTNLDFGHYTFRIRTEDQSGKPSPNEAMISFDIDPPFWKTWWFIGAAVSLLLVVLFYWMRRFQNKIRTQKILHSCTASMYEQNTMDDIAWDLAQNCVGKLGFVDCVVYIMDDEKNLLVQKAACGPKNPQRREILNPIEIPLGKGIVGHVAQSLRAEIIDDTSRDSRYIIDDVKRLSEISVPIVADGHVYGVIDSEHPSKNFFTAQHLYLLTEIAATCATRISKYITEQRLRTKIARDLHDDMGSALSSININSKMALQNADENTIVKNYLQNIRDNSGNMLESMSDIVWAINPDNDTMEKLVIRMKEFSAEILEPLNITYSFNGEMQLEQVKVDLNKRKNLYLVFKEAINNAAKYSNCTEVAIQLETDERNICLFVRDNGKGFNLEQARAGNGLRNMHERARAVRANLEIDSSPGNGTSVHLKLPIT
jgi:signal transduction histidine kinase